MDERTYLTILYDYYGDLLNDKQHTYFEEYYFNNLSLSEISENYHVSRNAIHKQLKSIESDLINFESKLHLFDKGVKLDKIISNIKDDKIKKQLENLK